MGGLNPSIPLSVNPAQAPQGPLDQAHGVLSLQDLMNRGALQKQSLQTGALEQQQRQQAIDAANRAETDREATTKALSSWDGKDYTALPSLVLKNGGSSQAVFGVTQHIQDMKAKAAEIAKNDSETNSKNVETATKQHDQERGQLQAIVGAPKDQQQSMWDSYVTSHEKAGTIQPGSVSHDYLGDDKVTALANTHALGSVLAKEAAEKEQADARMKAAGKGPEGELPLGEKVPQLNDALTARFQILNPGKPLPPAFALPANATQKDFDRSDKIMQQMEQARGTKAQQDSTNALREQTAKMSAEKTDIQPVTGTDPKTGKDVLVSMDDAKKMGLTGTMKADADMVNKSTAARHWIQLADKEGETPDKMGIMQLIDKLDGEGKLGVVSSRWNDFMAGKIGSGDPEFTALRAKMGLGNTKLMQAHVGSRGGAFMMEHFEDLANAKKMDGPTLKAGVAAELDYMKDVAMAPDKGGAKAPGGAAAKPAGSGKTLTSSQLQQAATDHGVTLEEATRQAKAAGYAVQ